MKQKEKPEEERKRREDLDEEWNNGGAARWAWKNGEAAFETRAAEQNRAEKEARK